MMHNTWLDFSSVMFWLLWGVAFLCLNLAPNYCWHTRLRYSLNISVFYILVGGLYTFYILIGAYLFYLMMRVLHYRTHGVTKNDSSLKAQEITNKDQVSDPPDRWMNWLSQIPIWVFYIPILSIILLLFIMHKGADLTYITPLSSIVTPTVLVLLATVGFSYVMLRCIDVMQSVTQQGLYLSSIDTINYLLPFHMLTAGPIQSFQAYQNAEKQRQDHWSLDRLTTQSCFFYTHPDTQRYLQGLERMAQGLFKKYVIAAAIHTLFIHGFHSEGWLFVLEIQMFYLWLYFDFSAYSDLAVGIGICLNIPTPENFNRPLSSRNLIDFWERWHISLSQWIRVRLYLPIHLGFTRKTRNAYPTLGAIIAFSCAFLVCGVWHEVSWRFFIWGGFHAIGLSVCHAYRTWLNRHYGRKWVRQVYSQNIYIRLIAQILTFEFVALSLLFAFYPT
jgi:D-alanyl-lipoteichoic acid acyltransferase DltB (MBOAT superfamily)